MKNCIKPFLLVVIGLIGLSGCSSLIPYEEEFACKRPDNMGKCINTEQAYEEARSGNSVTPVANHTLEVTAAMKDRSTNGSAISP